MSSSDQINLLKKHIYELSAEISILKRKINPGIQMEDYKKIHANYLYLTNLVILAKNELGSLMHLYKIVLNGNVTGDEKSNIIKKQLRRKIVTEIDCDLKNSRRLNLALKAHSELYAFIQSNYGSLFEDGKFHLQRVMQVK